MARDIVKETLEIVCEMSGKDYNGTLESIWDMGLDGIKNDTIRLALKCYCKYKEDTFMPTPAGFMAYLKYDDPDGSKAAEKRIEETKKMLERYDDKRK